LLNYEVIEAPNNLNFSRSFPVHVLRSLTHVGALLTYQPLSWLSVTFGTVVGWDDAKDNNSTMSYTGLFAFTPIKDIDGEPQLDHRRRAEPQQRRSADGARLRVQLHGLQDLTLGLNVDYGWEYDEAYLKSTGTRRTTTPLWWGWAAYAAYDWTEKLRTALRLSYFEDAEGVARS
jgi:hypothetical protein